MASWQLWIVRVIEHFIEKYLFGSLFQLSFFLLLSIPPSRLSWFSHEVYDFMWYFVHIIIIIYYLRFFLHQCQLMVFHRSLSDSKSQVSKTLLSILAVLNNVVFWMVSICPLISKSSRPFNNPLDDCTKSTNHDCIIVTFMFHNFFNSKQGPGTIPSFPFLSVLFCCQGVDFADFYKVWSSDRD